jgi:hypothetical protein
MEAAARSRQRSWHNELPQGICVTASYQGLTGSLRRTLQIIADCCQAQPDGSLVGAFGGRVLIERIACSRATFWRHVAALTRCGLLVVISRGGTVDGRNYGNVYAIPATPGGLEGYRVSRRMQRMIRGDDGRYRPQIIEAGQQAVFWKTPRGPATREVNGGRVRPVATPIPSRGLRGGWPGRHLTIEDLGDDDALLALYQAAVAAELVIASQDALLGFVAAAEHALSRGRNAPGLFVWLIWHRREGLLFPTIADEERARMRIRDWDDDVG